MTASLLHRWPEEVLGAECRVLRPNRPGGWDPALSTQHPALDSAPDTRLSLGTASSR